MCDVTLRGTACCILIRCDVYMMRDVMMRIGWIPITSVGFKSHVTVAKLEFMPCKAQ